MFLSPKAFEIRYYTDRNGAARAKVTFEDGRLSRSIELNARMYEALLDLYYRLWQEEE